MKTLRSSCIEQPIAPHFKGSNMVGREFGRVTRISIKSHYGISIVAVQSLSGTNPHKTSPILGNGINCIMGQAVAGSKFIENGFVSIWFPVCRNKAQPQKQYSLKQACCGGH